MKAEENTNDSQELQATARNTLQNSFVHNESQKDSGSKSKPNNPVWKCGFVHGHVEQSSLLMFC